MAWGYCREIFLVEVNSIMLYRKARFSDTETIYNLIAVYAKNGEMLARSRNTLYENLRDLWWLRMRMERL